MADLTGLLDLGSWQQKIPGLRVCQGSSYATSRCTRTANGPPTGRTARPPLQLIATNTNVGQIAWLDARHRSHVHVENDVKQAKDLV